MLWSIIYTLYFFSVTEPPLHILPVINDLAAGWQSYRGKWIAEAVGGRYPLVSTDRSAVQLVIQGLCHLMLSCSYCSITLQDHLWIESSKLICFLLWLLKIILGKWNAACCRSRRGSSGGKEFRGTTSSFQNISENYSVSSKWADFLYHCFSAALTCYGWRALNHSDTITSGNTDTITLKQQCVSECMLLFPITQCNFCLVMHLLTNSLWENDSPASIRCENGNRWSCVETDAFWERTQILSC